MTRAEDLEQALVLGADFLGFIVYPKSPRYLPVARAAELAARVSPSQRVVVDVAPSVSDLLHYREQGFERFQVHADLPLSRSTLAAWATAVGRERLWLAPRLSPEATFPAWVLEYTQTIVLDTYSKHQVGGTGKTGDFERFARLKQQYPDTCWILAGGLAPANVADAVRRSTTCHIDVNSGVEAAPGEKDPDKLRELFQVLRSDRGQHLVD